MYSEELQEVVKVIQQLRVEIYSKSLVRAIGKILLMKFGKNTN